MADIIDIANEYAAIEAELRADGVDVDAMQERVKEIVREGLERDEEE